MRLDRKLDRILEWAVVGKLKLSLQGLWKWEGGLIHEESGVGVLIQPLLCSGQ